MAIVWTRELCTEIDEIDHQHERLVDYINKLEGAIKQQNRALVGQVLDELVDYTLSHFAFEESLLEEAGYKLAKPHKAVHEMFVKRVAKYQDRHNGGENVAEQLLGMLGTWLVHHIKRDDMAYVFEVRGSICAIVQDKNVGNWLSRSLGLFFK